MLIFVIKKFLSPNTAEDAYGATTNDIFIPNTVHPYDEHSNFSYLYLYSYLPGLKKKKGDCLLICYLNLKEMNPQYYQVPFNFTGSMGVSSKGPMMGSNIQNLLI